MAKVSKVTSTEVANVRKDIVKIMESVGISDKSINYNGGWFPIGTVVTLTDKMGGVDKDGHITTDPDTTIYFGILTSDSKPIPVSHFATPTFNSNIGLIGVDEFDSNGVQQRRIVQGTLTMPVQQAFEQALKVEDATTIADVAAFLKVLATNGNAKFEYLGTAIQQMTTRKASSEVSGRNGWTPSETYGAGYKRTRKIHLWKQVD